MRLHRSRGAVRHARPTRLDTALTDLHPYLYPESENTTMSDLFDRNAPQYQPPQHTNPTKRRGRFVRVVFFLCLLVLFLVFCSALSSAFDADKRPATVVNQDGTTTAQDDQPAEDPAEYTPVKSAYKLKVKTIEKTCFGSAGCNETVRVTVDIVDQAAVGTPVDITYKLTGTDDGAQIDTISLDDEGQYDRPETMVSVRTSNSQVKAKITEVEGS